MRGGERYCVGQYHEWDQNRPRAFKKGPWFKMRVAGERTQRKDSIFVERRDFDLQVLENKLFFNK